MLFVPIIVADQVFDGRTKSSAITASAIRAGAAARQATPLRDGALGRDKARTHPNALTASVIVTRSLNGKRTVSAADAISGLRPSVAKNTTAAIEIAMATATHHIAGSETESRRV